MSMTKPNARRYSIIALSLFAFLGLLAAISYGCAVSMPGRSHSGGIPGLTNDESRIRQKLEAHVQTIAKDIGERNITRRYSELTRTAFYIEKVFKDLGYTVSSQKFEVDGQMVRNLEAELTGTDLKSEIIVIGAHYDSAIHTPAANDNASGVAGLLETARILRNSHLPRTVRFAAFVNEEPPYFHTADMGSLRYAKMCEERNDDIIAMLSLETIGYYSDAPGSQQYPPPLSALYPEVGNFITFVGNISSRSLTRECVRIFRETTALPCEGAALPGSLTGIDWSDHWSFWEVGYDAVMVTDTATFRYPYYHESEDTLDKIDFARTARAVSGVAKVITHLASKDWDV
jgi:hypothetical protein